MRAVQLLGAGVRRGQVDPCLGEGPVPATVRAQRAEGGEAADGKAHGALLS